MIKLVLRASALAVAAWGFVLGSAIAETPATTLKTAGLIQPAAAWTAYNAMPTGGSHTNGIAADASRPPEIKALAKGLGSTRIGTGGFTALDYSQKVYDYVRNNIETEFRFGLSKGARGALIDQSGTSFDQAALMIELLREGGVTATYKVGTITLTAQQFGLWSGLIKGLDQGGQTFTVDKKTACQFLADGAIPATVDGASSCASLSDNLGNVTLGHVWVSANSKLYDPAYKKHTFKAGMALQTAMNCGAAAGACGDSATTAAMSGSTSSTVAGAPARTNVNETGLNANLQTKAVKLQGNIEALGAAELSDVVSGMDIDTTYSPAPQATALAYPSTATTPTYSWTDIPDRFRTTLQVRFKSHDRVFFADEIAGKRVRYFGLDAATAQIAVENTFFPATSCGTCVTDTLILNVNHPYVTAEGNTYADDQIDLITDAQPVKAVGPITIIHGFGNASAHTEQHYADLQKADPSPFFNNAGLKPGAPTVWCGGSSHWGGTTSVQCRNDGQPTVVAKLLTQGTKIDQIAAGVGNGVIQRHHTLGLLGSDPAGSNGSSMMSVQAAVSISEKNGVATGRTSLFETTALTWSMLEGSVSQQQSDGWMPDSAIGYIVLANRKSIPLLSVTSANMATVLGSVTDYATDRKSRLQALATAGFDSVLPKDGMIGSFTFPSLGSGTMTYIVGGDLFYKSNSVAYLISEAWKGGGALQGLDDPAKAAAKSAELADYAVNKKDLVSVLTNSGDVTLSDVVDIKTGAGEFPMSLPFKRTYNSRSGGESTVGSASGIGTGTGGISPIGYNFSSYDGPDSGSYTRIGGGWTNNYLVTASLGGDGLRAMGAASGLDATTVVTAMFTLNDIFKNPTFDRRLTSIFVGQWLNDRLTANVATVNVGGSTEVFLKLPDNRYNPPPGKASSLTVSGARIAEAAPTPFIIYDYSAVTLTYTGADGAVISFNPAVAVRDKGISQPSFKATQWAFPNGMKLSFTYAAAVDMPSTGMILDVFSLSKVENNLGRSLTFTASDWRLTKVTDETGREVNYNCAKADASPTFACDTLIVTSPSGEVSKYDYVADAESPNPTVPTKQGRKLRRWYVPSDTSNAFETIVYDEVLRAKTMKDALGRITNYYLSGITGDEIYNVASMIDALGNVETTTYDERGNLVASADPLGRVTTYAYDASNRKVLTTFPEGNREEFKYDVRSNTIETRLKSKVGSGLSDIFSLNVFSEDVNVRKCINPRTCNRPVSSTDPNGKVTNYIWESTTGYLSQVSKPAPGGVGGSVRPVTDLGYTNYTAGGATFSLLTSKTEKVSAAGDTLITTYAYNPSNKYVLLTATVDTGTGGVAAATSFTFDAIGNLTQIDGPRADVGDVSNFVWDSSRRLKFAIQADPDGAGTLLRPATKYTYDPDGQLITTEFGKTTASDGTAFTALKKTEYEYDEVGNKTREKVHDGVAAGLLKLTQYSYDADDRPLCTMVRMNPAGALPTDACTAAAAGSFGADRMTKTIYDAAGQTTKTIRSFGNGLAQDYATNTYSNNGKPLTSQDANYNLSTMEYDGHDRLVKLRFPSLARPVSAAAATSSTTDYESYTYDANGNRLTFRKRDNQVITYGYDDLNREVLRDFPGGTTNDVYTNYDLMDRKLWARYASTGGTGIEYTWDKSGRMLSEVDSAASRTLSYQYDKANNRTKVTYPGGTALAVDYTYDALNRVKTIVENPSTNLVTYTYDQLGRRDDMARGNTAATDYAYDNVDRLTSLVQNLNGTTYDITFGYAYNPASQAISRSASNDNYQWVPASAATKNLTHNGLNQDAAIAALGACGISGAGFDCNGNLTNDGSRTFTYDAENRLVSSPSANLAVTYDPLGRLKQTAVTSGATTQFLYDGDRLVAEYNGSGTLLRRYVHGTGTDEPLVWYEGSALSDKRWLHHDAQGSVIAWSNGTGVMGEVYAYGSYGEPLNDNWTGSRFRYTGQIAIPEAELYHYKARVYDPEMGRFLQADPIGYKNDLNLYAYVGNDSLNRSDPTGRVIEISGTKADKKEFIKAAQQLTGLKLKERNGKLVQVGAANAKKGNQVAAAVLSAAIKSTTTIKMTAVSGDAKTFGDNFFNAQEVDAEDLTAFEANTPNLGAAILAHVITERMYNKEAGYGRTIADFREAHDVGIAQEIKALGIPATARETTADGDPAGPATIGFVYTDSSSNVVSSVVLMVDPNGHVQ
jgi:RHS repeat-associated protein